MLELSIHDCVSHAVCELDDCHDESLHPDEANVLRSESTPKRQQEFLCGRVAARMALERMGIETPPPVLKGKQGEPIWPKGIAGSITHAGQKAIAAVVDKEKYKSIGIDLERLERRFRHDVTKRICTDKEREWVRAEDSQKRIISLFSAKESIYKALYPLTGELMDFADVELEWNEESSEFKVTLLKDVNDSFKSGDTFQVGCRIEEGQVFTFAVID